MNISTRKCKLIIYFNGGDLQLFPLMLPIIVFIPGYDEKIYKRHGKVQFYNCIDYR